MKSKTLTLIVTSAIAAVASIGGTVLISGCQFEPHYKRVSEPVYARQCIDENYSDDPNRLCEQEKVGSYEAVSIGQKARYKFRFKFP